MALLAAFCVLFLVFNNIAGYTLINENDDYDLEWPSEYHVTGDDINFITKLSKPFEIWYSSTMNRSRIDYYDGTEKKYYYGDMGLILDEHPITLKNLLSETACIGEETTNPLEDLPDVFLPDVSDLVYKGTASVGDKVVDVWKSEEIEFNVERSETTMYVYRNRNGENIPVRKVFKNYNLKTGALTEHSITEYFKFEDTFPEDKLEYNKLSDCVIMADHAYVHLTLDVAFDSYTKLHKKNYKENEHEMRKNIFEKNLRKVRELNSQNLSFKLELNEFSDKTDEELSYLTGTIPTDLRYLDVSPFPHTLEEIDMLAEELPESFDLRMEGFITPVRNQGECGSCWAFCTTAAVEGAIAKANGGKLVDLSEQSLIDCAWGYETSGCSGGPLGGAFDYIFKYGIPTEEAYGDYKEQDGYCKVLNMSSTYKIDGFAMVTPRNPNALKLALHKYGPVAVTIHATDIMRLYSSGVFYDFTCEEEHVNHGVTVVGYGVRDGDEYWIVKNSWGESWGQAGYILMSFKNNNCFVLDTPFYAIVNGTTFL